ncbi:TonB-dependent receptor [Agriterribacter sp.]|uniref:TonB-dependent receptor plug domain-containing protein n=1 Tax=Agriterribacter sp. TaxID=2821509 RepID=UPI002CA19C6E|nr:TonB-dependent receptor [Agriterribacter sp.]HRO46367.1 TonB-dependent receptor [Agriterribacter sp.]HRQ18554.1 TonB-dependent receptor [Agriterribacter sp.]
MIFKNSTILIFILHAALTVPAQEDSSFNTTITLQEVVVQHDARLRNSTEKKHSADLQTSTDQLLESIAGVNMIRRGNYAWEPTIRGLNAGQVNVTISGMAIFGACTDRMDPASSYIEPNNLQSITVNYGAGNQSYGSTIGGGFNFKLKQPHIDNEKRFTGLAGVGYETNAHALQTLAALEYSGKRFAIRGNGIFRKAGNYNAGGGEEIAFSQYAKWNGGLSATYRVAEHHFINVDYIQDEGWDIGYPALLMDVSFAKAKIASASHLYQPHSKHLHRWETKWYYNTISHAMDDTKRPKDQVPIHMDMPGTSRTLGFYTEAQWAFGSRHHIATRLNGYSNRLHAEMTMYPDGAASMFMLTIPDAQRNVIGLDISDKIALTPKTELMSGVRADYTGSSLYSAAGKQLLSGMHAGDLNRNHILYNAYINGQYRANEHWVLYANVARAMRGATLQEMYGFYLFNRTDGFDYIGNPRLSRETSWNFGTGARFRQKIFTVEGQAFAYVFNNYIAGKPLAGYSVMTMGANGVKQYDNISSAVLYGAEATVLVQPFSFLNIKSNNTYTRGQDADNNALPLIAPFKSVNTVSVVWKEYRFSASSVHAAAQHHVSSEMYGELPSKAYGIVNLGAGRSFPVKAVVLDFNIALANVFDNNYYEHLDILKLPRQGRNMVMHLTVKF